MSTKFIVFDGRAAYDLDAACILEVLDVGTKKQAKRQFRKEYRGLDAVLVGFDTDGDKLINPKIVPTGEI